MARRRCFSTQIVQSDAFLSMPASARELYFQLGMAADDEGFVGSPQRVQRMIGAADDDMRLLIAKKFLLVFDSGVVVLKHWKINNLVRSDRFKTTAYLDEKSLLYVKENGAYTFDSSQGKPALTCGDADGIPMVYQWYPQPNLTKPNLNNKNMDACASEKARFSPPSLSEVQAYIREKGYHFDAESFIAYYESNGWVQSNGKAKIKSWKACCVTWEKHATKEKGAKHDFGEYAKRGW